MCAHEEFSANVNVNRLSSKEGGPITSYLVEVEVRCAHCGQPFRFIVPEVGIIPNGAGTNALGTMLHVYAEPADGSLAPSIRPGYSIRANNPSNPSEN